MLRSSLFAGNKELTDASKDPSKHIVRNDKRTGLFVSKIQEALILLDYAIIKGDDISKQRYGDSTADAVLEYKSRPGKEIINRTYQSEPDDIVGVMTMAHLDKEILELESRMPAMIEEARMAAFQRTFSAWFQVTPVGPPGEPKRVDPNETRLVIARQHAARIFDDNEPNMEWISDVIGDMRNWLMQKSFTVMHLPDERISGRSAFVVGNRPPICLCPLFFAGDKEQRIRTFIHESAHLHGVGDSQGESYYLKYNTRNEPPNYTIGNPTSNVRETFADTWAKYVNAITNQPADADDHI